MKEDFKKYMYDHIKDCSKDYSDNVALEYYGLKWKYRDFYEIVENTARGLLELGVKPADVVTVCSLNTPEAVFMVCALNKIGAIISPIDANSNENSINYYANLTKSKWAFTNDTSYERVLKAVEHSDIEKVIISGVTESISPKEENEKNYDGKFVKYQDLYEKGKKSNMSIDFPYDEKRPAIYMATGGTTGVSKIVGITNEGMIAANEYYKSTLNFLPGKTYMTFLPLMIVSGINANLFLPLCSAETASLCLSYDPKDFVGNVLRTQPDTIVAAPVYWIKLANAIRNGEIKKEDLPIMENPISAGDYMIPNVEKQCNDILPFKLKKAYALTESTSCGIVTTNDNNEIGSMGKPAKGLAVKLMDINLNDDKTEVGINETGHIYLYGDIVAQGYLNNEKENEITFGINEEGERFVRTGDLGRKDETGNYYFEGRIKRMILRKGYNIFPALIENAIMTHPAVLNCAVVGIPHYEDGEVPVAFISLKSEFISMEELVKEQIKNLVANSVPFYFQPEEYDIIENIPTTEKANKVDYRALKLLKKY